MAFPVIFTKFLGPTDHKGSRVKAWTLDKRSVTIAWDHALNARENHDSAARALASKLGLHGTMIAADGDACYVYSFVRRTFESGGFADSDTIDV